MFFSLWVFMLNFLFMQLCILSTIVELIYSPGLGYPDEEIETRPPRPCRWGTFSLEKPFILNYLSRLLLILFVFFFTSERFLLLIGVQMVRRWPLVVGIECWSYGWASIYRSQQVSDMLVCQWKDFMHHICCFHKEFTLHIHGENTRSDTRMWLMMRVVLAASNYIVGGKRGRFCLRYAQE